MKAPVICLAILLLIAYQSESFAQVPSTITYQGIIQKDGSAFTGDGVFTFTLYKHATTVWSSQPITIHVAGGLFSTVLGPFPDSLQFNGIDSLGVTFGGTELSPRIAFTSVAYSLYSLHAVFADSSKTPGPKGDPGQQGLQGLKGDKGEKGDSGTIGAQGLKGDKGEKGDSGSHGPQGLKGDKGDPGEQGIHGLKGDKGEKGDIGLEGLQGLKGDKGDSGAQGVKGDKGDPNPISSTDGTNGASVFSFISKTGPHTVQVALVRTGNTGTLRLEIPTDPALTAIYSALWFSGNGTGSAVEAHYGTVGFGSSAVFDIDAAHQFSIMVKIGNQWAKVDLFRGTPTDDNWYGFSTTN